MALFNEILVGRLNRWAQKFYAIKSGQASLTQLLPTVQTVNVIQSGVEDRYLQGWNRYAFIANPVAVAAQFCKSQIRNPVGSGVIAVVEGVIVASSLADSPSISLTTTSTDLTTASTIVNRLDARGNQSPALHMSLGTTAAGAPGNAQWVVAFAANTTFQLIQNVDQQITILPGDALVVNSGVVNQTLVMNFMWRERPLESSELT